MMIKDSPIQLFDAEDNAKISSRNRSDNILGLIQKKSEKYKFNNKRDDHVVARYSR